MKKHLFVFHFFLFIFQFHFIPAHAQLADEAALTPREVVVVASIHAPDSIEIAKEYMKLRSIPENQLLTTGLPQDESVSRRDYNQYIAEPVKNFLLHEHLDHVRCLVLIYGIPLKVLEPNPFPDEKKIERRLREERDSAIGTTIELVKRADALANSEDKKRQLPSFDPKTSAREQLNQLGRRIIEDLRTAQQRLQALSGVERAKLQGEIGQFIHDAFGDDSEGAWRMIRLQAPAPPSDLKQRIARLGELAQSPLTPAILQELLKLLRQTRGELGVVNGLDAMLVRIHPDGTWRASVDSELACVLWPDYPLIRNQLNTLGIHVPHGAKTLRTLMVCRLDGPDAATVRRMISDGLAIEQNGLIGKAYFDARGSGLEDQIGEYDASLHHLAKLIQEKTTMTAVLESTEKLFQPGACPDAALYCGWYHLGEYIPAFTWSPGAVAWHIASDEARTLHKPGAKNWCPALLRAGAAATLGPVEEPYLTAFPKPDEFFGLLLTGRFTLADCYWKTTPYVSWMITLIGDPLYNPFKAHPALDLADFVDYLQGETEP